MSPDPQMMLSQTRREAEQRADEFERLMGRPGLPGAREEFIMGYMDGACARLEKSQEDRDRRRGLA